ncbi:hypothetical protein, partial [Streptomyces albidochromogenes]|uniref:hypothetical protein n=1 Tax=Streptomyces albidochromogenes TaxID=329524 RepID=UPI001ABF0683
QRTNQRTNQKTQDYAFFGTHPKRLLAKKSFLNTHLPNSPLAAFVILKLGIALAEIAERGLWENEK